MLSSDLITEDGITIEDFMGSEDPRLSFRLPKVRSALGSLEGVESVDAFVWQMREIVGHLVVRETSTLTPAGVYQLLKRHFPPRSWPDRILITVKPTFADRSCLAA